MSEEEPLYSLKQVRAAFKAGWHTRNKQPGLKKLVPNNLSNALGLLMGVQSHEVRYVPDKRVYHNSIWLNSQFKKDLVE